MNTKNDERILNLQKQIEEKKAELIKTVNPTWNTNCSYKTFNNAVFNLHTLTKLDIVSCLSDLIQRKNAWIEACQLLSENNCEFLIGGYTYEEWVTDFQTRYAVCNVSTERIKLTNMENLLREMESNELKTERKLKEIEEALK